MLHAVILAVLVCAPATYRVDATNTVVAWRGTKGLGLGSHEGIVRVQDGSFQMNDRELIGGSITIDMRTIEVTDIPPSDPIPRERIRSHLADEDFFYVARFPTASLRIVSATRDGTRYQITGNMTIRGVTRRLVFPMTVAQFGNQLRATGEVTLNRRAWGVSFAGLIRDKLVDDDFTLRITLVAKRGA